MNTCLIYSQKWAIFFKLRHFQHIRFEIRELMLLCICLLAVLLLPLCFDGHWLHGKHSKCHLQFKLVRIPNGAAKEFDSDYGTVAKKILLHWIQFDAVHIVQFSKGIIFHRHSGTSLTFAKQRNKKIDQAFLLSCS